MVTAAILWTLVSAAYGSSALRVMTGSGDPLSGLGDFLVGLAAAIAAISSWLNSRKAKANAADAKDSSAAAAQALGPANGITVLELLHRNQAVLDEIKRFEEYQHGRNHDVLNELTQLKLAIPLVRDVGQRLLDKLKETT